MENTNKLIELDWDNDEAKIANELAMHTEMRAGEIQTLTVDDLGELNLSEEDVQRISQRFGIA